MNELACFAGSGGGILGGYLLGWRTVCAVEIDAYAASILIARQNDGILPPFPIWDDVRTFDGKPWRGIVDVVSGGFPCQDISCAGRGGGIEGVYSGLWKEMARIIGEVRPRFVLVENSPILTSRGLGTVLGDMATLGYDAKWGVLGAIDAGAPHLRNRIWIMAHSQSARRFAVEMERQSYKENTDAIRESSYVSHTESIAVRAGLRQGEPAGQRRRRSGNGDSAGAIPDTDAEYENNSGHGASKIRGERYPEAEIFRSFPDAQGAGLEGENTAVNSRTGDAGCRSLQQTQCDWWATEPDVGRVANGVAARVDRLKALGEGQVPAVVRLAWEVIN